MKVLTVADEDVPPTQQRVSARKRPAVSSSIDGQGSRLRLGNLMPHENIADRASGDEHNVHPLAGETNKEVGSLDADGEPPAKRPRRKAARAKPILDDSDSGVEFGSKLSVVTPSANTAKKGKAAKGAANKKTTTPTTTNSSRRRTKAEKMWTTAEFLADAESPFANEDLANMFNQDVWENALNDQDRATLLAMVPAFDKLMITKDDGEEAPEIDPKIWKAEQVNRNARQMQEDQRMDRFTPTFTQEATKARADRMKGVFDTWKEEEYEKYWGQKMRIDYTMIAGDTAQVTLKDMLKGGALRVDDVLKLRRAFGTGAVIEKECKLLEINDEYGMRFRFPSGTQVWEKGDHPNKEIENISTLTSLESAMCREHGGGPDRLPNGNAWKTFRVVRRGQDIGAMFEVRAMYHYQFGRKNKA